MRHIQAGWFAVGIALSFSAFGGAPQLQSRAPGVPMQQCTGYAKRKNTGIPVR